MKTLLICGSNSILSCTRAMMEALDDALVMLGAQTVLWDLRAVPLPIAYPDLPSPHGVLDPPATRLCDAVRAAAAVALGSPLYHGSFSGVLKNALDHLPRDAFKGKPVALLSHGSSERRCGQPCEHLQAVVAAMAGYALPTQVATAKGDFASDPHGKPILQNADMLQRIDRQARELVALVQGLHQSTLTAYDDVAMA